MSTVHPVAAHPAGVTRPSRRTRPLAVLAVTCATVAVWAVAVPLAGVDLVARSGGADRTVGPGAVAGTTLLVGLAGWAVLALLERRTRRARSIWTGLALAVLLVSLLPPLAEGVGTAAKLTLVTMHLVAGLLVPALGRTAPR
ncbi:DUF6069 family protein [Micromonospora mirobrigensis]|uniref:Uncharacterized protein n=1 Tax=Micromonospora mirobrigensis TaxID=262898 RepID=A0A1C4W6U1_9ACTN|nr:DUF6069 family protein [Micromonospora mirobrigensis]SCE91898.1 hypothetical protein GA0070564_10244 [Micromonospora mirobrigensis]